MDKTVWTTHSEPVSPEEKSNRSKVGKLQSISKEGKSGYGDKKAMDVCTTEAGKTQSL
jgi:hypothetical protein